MENQFTEYVDSTDAYGWSPLTMAVIQGCEDAVRYWLTNGADVNHADNDGRTAAHHAAEDCHLPILRMLVQHGADLNIKCANGDTPLDIASRGLCPKTTEYLQQVAEKQQ